MRTPFRRINTSFICAGLFLFPAGLLAGRGGSSNPIIGYEVVGQVLNPSPQQSSQYGYLNFIKGLDRITTSAGTAVSESTALFTFHTDTATERVINNGPMRLVDRTGTGAIYFGSGNSDFANPDTFKRGTAVQSFTLRHQVVIDTATGYFTTTFEIAITSAKVFSLDGKSYRLGRPGGVYRLNVSGKLTAQGPPSAHIAGAADGTSVELVEVE